MPRIFRLLAAVPAALLLLLAVAGPAEATRVTANPVACPLDGTSSKRFEHLSANTHGGWDSDLCTYSSQGQWREYAITTCPEDLLTLYGEDFARAYTPEELERLRAVSREVQREVRDPEALEPWERYALAARFYQALGKDEAFIGTLYHTASWLARDRAVGVYVGLEGPVAARELLALGAQELEKDLTTPARKTLLFNLARVAHRAGENTLRDRYIGMFAARTDLDAAEQEALARFRKMTREVEPRYQDLAIEQYTAWLRKEGIPHDEKVRITYLLADLLRRRDRLREAAALYTLVANDSQALQSTRELAAFLLGEIIDEVDPG